MAEKTANALFHFGEYGKLFRNGFWGTLVFVQKMVEPWRNLFRNQIKNDRIQNKNGKSKIKKSKMEKSQKCQKKNLKNCSENGKTLKEFVQECEFPAEKSSRKSNFDQISKKTSWFVQENRKNWPICSEKSTKKWKSLNKNLLISNFKNKLILEQMASLTVSRQ